MRRSVAVIIILFWINTSFSQRVIHINSEIHYKTHSDDLNLDLTFYPEKGFQDYSTKQLYFQNELDFGSYEVLSFEFKEELVEFTSNNSNSLHYDENYKISFRNQEENYKVKKTQLLLSCIRSVNGKNYRITKFNVSVKKTHPISNKKNLLSSSHNLFYPMDGTGSNLVFTKADCTKLIILT